MSEPFIAEVRIWANNFAPRGWSMCDGQLMQIAQNTALFSLVGTTYGGDGRTTFGLPNLKGRAPMHWGTGPGLTPRAWGQTGGTPAVTLVESQIPAHSHEIKGQNAAGDTNAPANRYLATDKRAGLKIRNLKADANPNTTMSLSTLTNTGGTKSHENRQPYLALNFCIATIGLYPSRN
ncbi:phage tail protein [Pseudoalteromonas spongiae]|uniref:Tail fiber protein n=1 Tax=Pseudoalteromonas spongiae TaxID=298657 RepID=A0ABU8F177_9GAMM